MVEVSCPKCGKSGSVPDEYRGKQITCRKCTSKFVVGKSPGNLPIGAANRDAKQRELNLAALNIPLDVLALIPESVAKEHNVLPIGKNGDVLRVAVPENSSALIQTLEFIANGKIDPVVARREDILTEITRRYQGVSKPETQPQPQVVASQSTQVPSPKRGFWASLFGKSDSKQETVAPLDLPAERGTLVFGPFAASVAAEMTARGISNLHTRVRLNKLTHEPKVLTTFTLVFAHCIPSRAGQGKSEKDMNAWAVKLMEGSGLTPGDFYAWTIEWHGDVADNRVTTKFMQSRVYANQCLSFANALEQSFLKNGGKNSYGKDKVIAPAAPTIVSGLVSVEEIQRIDEEMGEMNLHCPGCGADERINDMGKLMLSQGNNVFANYTCKGCGKVFDGAQHIRRGKLLKS